jgi:predicted transposase YdaD
VVFANLARAARRKLEIEMGLENYEYQSEFAKKFIALGREEGREAGREEGRRTGEVEASRSLLRAVAAARGLALTEAQLERIDACDDANVLQTWATRAATASEADEIF